jgi:ABC-2 type transport system ATP-binding protein
VLGLVDEMAEDGKTVLMCTHLLLEAEGLADQVIVMDHGRAVVAGSPAELSRRYWPAARVLLDADNPSVLDAARDLPFVRAFERNGVVMVDLDHDTDVPDLVDALVRAGARLKRVEPCAPSLEELYFTIRKQER